MDIKTLLEMKTSILILFIFFFSIALSNAQDGLRSFQDVLKEEFQTKKNVFVICVTDYDFDKKKSLIKFKATVTACIKGEAEIGDEILFSHFIEGDLDGLDVDCKKGNIFIVFTPEIYSDSITLGGWDYHEYTDMVKKCVSINLNFKEL